MLRKKLLFTFFILSLLYSNLYSQTIKQMEFKNQNLTDILLVLAETSGTSIVADETVTGTTSFFFTETSFKVALESFLNATKLYYRLENGIYYVSKIRFSNDAAKDLITIDGEDIDISFLIKTISRASKKTLVWDMLPRSSITFHVAGVLPFKATEMIMARFPDYTVIQDTDAIYIKRKDTQGTSSTQSSLRSGALTRNEDGTYSIDIDQARLLPFLDDLMKQEKKEYMLLIKTDVIIERLKFVNKSFEQLIRIVLDQANVDFAVRDDIFYFFEIQKRDPSKKYKTTVVYPFSFLSVQDALSLMPQDLSNSAQIKIDKNTNSLILTGSNEELMPVMAFFKQMDVPLSGREYYRFHLKYIKAKEAVSALPPRFQSSTPVFLSDEYDFLMLMTPDGYAEFNKYLALVDEKRETKTIVLKYIKTEDLLKNLPPSVAKEDIIDSGYPSTFYFMGSDDKLKRFKKDLESIDKPKPQIKYDILIIQFEKKDNVVWSKTLNAEKTTKTADYLLTGVFTKLLTLNFDVISEFGYLFAVKLNMEIGSSNANVFADTSLTGISGQDMKFQNTSTYRYTDPGTNPDTGKPTTGVTRELASGIVLGINGWVSGDGMITMTVNTTVSKRTDTSTTGQAPETTERIVSTQLRTESGKPIAITGLIQKDKSLAIKKIPLLSDIPFLGKLFSDINKVENDTEMVIYITPRVLPQADTSAALKENLAELYRLYGSRSSETLQNAD